MVALSRAKLVLHRKLITDSGLLIERKIWSLTKSNRYGHGIKYRLVLADPIAKTVLVLYDNHWPKGPHVHWGDKERTYEFVGLEQLLRDFAEEVRVEEVRYNENKKNRH